MGRSAGDQCCGHRYRQRPQQEPQHPLLKMSSFCSESATNGHNSHTFSICEVGYRDKSILRFSTIVTGYLEKEKLSDIEGMKTKVMIWVKVTCISADGGKLHFTAGMNKTRG
ncbi:hypothetical protein HYC85_007992 [Camellia sinensis]|uniref:Uncharacterized protein n=1 Tax=Camellia sinensis TaxID=4442 RepID=A0A7J7HSW6_CAMSI|nr:hypothetical protein HYC85_007992 [Camellia sinensis]